MEMENENITPIDRPMGNASVAQQDLPNSTGILTMGIISLVFFMGLIGLILSIISLSLASKAKNLYNEDPSRYTAKSLSRVNSGRTCAIISLCLFGATLLIALLIAAANS